MVLTESQFNTEFQKLNENKGKLYNFFSILAEILNTDIKTIIKRIGSTTTDLYKALRMFSFDINDFINAIKTGYNNFKRYLKVIIKVSNDIQRVIQTGARDAANATLVVISSINEHIAKNEAKYFFAALIMAALVVVIGVSVVSANPAGLMAFIGWLSATYTEFVISATAAINSFSLNTYIGLLHDYTVNLGINDAAFDFTGNVGASIQNVLTDYSADAQTAIQNLHDYTVNLGINDAAFDFTGNVWESISNSFNSLKMGISVLITKTVIPFWLDKIQ